MTLRFRLAIRGRVERALRPIGKALDWAFPPDELTKLANQYGTDKGNRVYAYHHYSRIYHRFFAHLRHRPITLLEIGLQWRKFGDRDVPSLRMWREYFSSARLIGFDIEDFSNVARPSDCMIVQGDMGSRQDLSKLYALGPFDIVIDDGSHASAHQQIALACLFPHVVPGGLYFIEDLMWQPPLLERADVPQTRALLRRKSFDSPVITRAEAQFLTENVESIQLFDTRGRGPYCRDKRDALAAITKILP